MPVLMVRNIGCMQALDLSGRVLFLCRDPGLLDEQFAGRDLSRDEAGALRDMPLLVTAQWLAMNRAKLRPPA